MDLCRLIYIAELCATAEFLTPDEAWERIMPAARQLQGSFDSWPAMAANFLVGKHFSTAQAPPSDALVARMFADPTDTHSPWAKCAWSEEL